MDNTDEKISFLTVSLKKVHYKIIYKHQVLKIRLHICIIDPGERCVCVGGGACLNSDLSIT